MPEHTVADANTILRVKNDSDPQKVAAAIAKAIDVNHAFPTLRAIGHGAIGQTCKAIAIARGLVAPKGMDLTVIIGFDTVAGDGGKDISAMTFKTLDR